MTSIRKAVLGYDGQVIVQQAEEIRRLRRVAEIAATAQSKICCDEHADNCCEDWCGKCETAELLRGDLDSALEHLQALDDPEKEA